MSCHCTEQEDKWDLKLTGRSPQDQQTRFRKKIPPLQQKDTPSCTCIATGDGKSCHRNANGPKLWPSGTTHGSLMVAQQLVLGFLLKWSGKGRMRGLWSDLSSAGSCLLRTGLSAPEFSHFGQQGDSGFPGCATRCRYAPEFGFLSSC